MLVTVLSGGVLALAGLVLLLPLPEVGVPLLLVGLRLLGRRYAWARRANAWVDHRARQVRDGFHRLPRLLRVLVLAGLVAAAVVLVVVALRHSPW